MNWFVTLICLLMGYNPDIMRNAPLHERVNLLLEFWLLTMISSASGVAWSCFFGQFEPWYIAGSIGTFMGLFIATVDRFIAASDWSLHGILRDPAVVWTKDLFVKLAVRVTMIVVFSYATSMGASMAMFGDAIEMELETLRRAENVRIMEIHDSEINTFL